MKIPKESTVGVVLCLASFHIKISHHINYRITNYLFFVLFSVCSLERIVTCYYWGAVCRLLCLRYSPLLFPYVAIVLMYILSTVNIGAVLIIFFFSPPIFVSQMMKLLVSVLVFEIGKMLYKSGIKMHLLQMKQISWEKSMSSSRTYLLKLFFISVSMPIFSSFIYFTFLDLELEVIFKLCRCLAINYCLS